MHRTYEHHIATPVSERYQQETLATIEELNLTDSVSPFPDFAIREDQTSHSANEEEEESTRATSGTEITNLISYFDRHYQEAGLPRNWTELNNGFSIRKQIDLWKAMPDTSDPEAIKLWITRTEMDIRGFCLEYLEKGRILYPVLYQAEQQPDGRQDLIDPIYRKGIAEMTSLDERNGSVHATLNNIKRFMLDTSTPDGSLSVMVSPKGESGMTMDNGKKIIYPDAYLFFFQKVDAQTVTGFGLRTDLTNRECRDVIATLTGKALSADAPVEAYVRAFARIRSDQPAPIKSPQEFLSLLSRQRSTADRPARLYKDVTSQQAEQDLLHAATLYTFDEQTNRIITQFRSFVTNLTAKENGPVQTKDIEKGLAAAILELSRIFINRDRWQQPGAPGENQAASQSFRQVGYGEAAAEIAARGGCNSSGSDGPQTLGLVSLVPREARALGEERSDEYCPEIQCPRCKWKPNQKEADAIEGGEMTHCQGQLPDGSSCNWPDSPTTAPQVEDNEAATKDWTIIAQELMTAAARANQEGTKTERKAPMPSVAPEATIYAHEDTQPVAISQPLPLTPAPADSLTREKQAGGELQAVQISSKIPA